MYLTELLSAAYVKESPPTADEIMLIPAGFKEGIDHYMVVGRKEFESVLIKYRATEPGSEAVLMTIGGAKPEDSGVWNAMLQAEYVLSHYTKLCDQFYADKLASIDDVSESVEGPVPAGSQSEPAGEAPAENPKEESIGEPLAESQVEETIEESRPINTQPEGEGESEPELEPAPSTTEASEEVSEEVIMGSAEEPVSTEQEVVSEKSEAVSEMDNRSDEPGEPKEDEGLVNQGSDLADLLGISVPGVTSGAESEEDASVPEVEETEPAEESQNEKSSTEEPEGEFRFEGSAAESFLQDNGINLNGAREETSVEAIEVSKTSMEEIQESEQNNTDIFSGISPDMLPPGYRGPGVVDSSAAPEKDAGGTPAEEVEEESASSETAKEQNNSTSQTEETESEVSPTVNADALQAVDRILDDFKASLDEFGVDCIMSHSGTDWSQFLLSMSNASHSVFRFVYAIGGVYEADAQKDTVDALCSTIRSDCVAHLEKNDLEAVNRVLMPIIQIIYEE